MSFNAYTPPRWWDRTRMLRYAFAAGLVLGVGMGWFFHGIISMMFRFGVVFLLMLPLVLLAFMWWRSSRERNRMQTSMTVVRWGNGPFGQHQGNNMAAGPFGNVRYDNEDVVSADDVPYQEPRR